MGSLTILKSDLKNISREKITLLLLCAPILLGFAFRAFIEFLFPLILQKLSFDFMEYINYILSMTMILSGGLVSVVIGFSMLDDKDSNIIPLINVTPMGSSGYITNRVFLTCILTFIYSFLNYVIIGEYIISIWQVFAICIVSSLYASCLGILIFAVCKDKMQGLTFAKTTNVLFVFMFAHLIDFSWLHIISNLFSTYHVAKMIISPSMTTNIIGVLVSLCWFAVSIVIFNKISKRV